MATELDDSQKRALDEMQGVYTEAVIDRALRPRNFGSLPGADGFTSVNSAGSDNIKMWLRVRNDRVIEASFWTDACAATIASLSMIIELVEGRSITRP